MLYFTNVYEKRCFIAIICTLLQLGSIAQSRNDQQISVSTSLPKQIIQDSADLKLRVLIMNNGLKDIPVYKYLSEGYPNDWHCNFMLEVEKKEKTGFRIYSRGSNYQMVPDPDSSYTIETIQLKPRDSIEYYFYLDEVFLFEPGEYRMRCRYKNDIKLEKKVSSSWLFFRIIKTIAIAHRAY